MNLAVVGMGRVGLVAAAAMADFGHRVCGVDVDQKRFASLKEMRTPFYEPGLDELVRKSQQTGRLWFSDDLGVAMEHAVVLFLAVGTEEKVEGQPNLGPLFEVGEQIARRLQSYRVLAIKSTVPVGTAARLRSHIRARTEGAFDLVSNPEFLREGSAIENFVHPDRVVIGGTSEKALSLVRDVYESLYLLGTPFVTVDHETAELIKYATNSFLAMKVTFINEMATLCDACGADVHAIARAVGLDKRIGPKFLHPGPGFGGSCLPKDVRTLSAIAREHQCTLPLVEAIDVSNRAIAGRLLQQLERRLDTLKGRTIAVLGLSYKPATDDVRESPAMEFVRQLLAAGASVRAHDPKANQEAARMLSHPSFMVCDSPFVAGEDADAVAVLTEWNEFRSLELPELRARMKGNVLLDTRNVYNPRDAREAGFDYVGRGRGSRPK